MKKRIEIFPEEMGGMPYIWLLFLLIPLLAMLPYDSIQKIGTLCLLTIFVIAYRNSYFYTNKFVLWMSIQYILATLFAIFYEGIYLFMFPAWMIGFSSFKKKTFFKYLMVMYGLMFISFGYIVWKFGTYISKEMMIMNVVYLVITTVAPVAARSMQKQINIREQLYQSNQRLEVVVKQEERKRIARDLHDTLGQSLSVITLKTEVAKKLMEKDLPRTRQELTEIASVSREALQSVRTIVTAMREVKILEELVSIEQALKASDIMFFTSGEEYVSKIGDKEQNVISYCLRECVTNIVRHSNAERCYIKISKDSERYVFQIIDNGEGSVLLDGNGIKGIKERVALLDGTATWEKEKGITVKLCFPVKRMEGHCD